MRTFYFKRHQVILTYLFWSLFVPLFSQTPGNIIIEYDAAGNRVLIHPESLQRNPNSNHTVNGSSDNNQSFGKTISDIGDEISSITQGAVVSIENFTDFLGNTIAQVFPSDNSKHPNEPFIVYPNPVKDRVMVTNKSDSMDTLYTIFLYNSLGKMVQQFESATIPFVINIASYSPGLYYLRIAKLDFQQTLKIVKI